MSATQPVTQPVTPPVTPPITPGKRPSLFRRQLVIDREIQYPLMIYSITMAGACIVLTALFSLLWVMMIEFEMPVWSFPLLVLLGPVVSLSLMIFIGLIITNKVAGPLSRLRLQMKAVADGDSPQPLVIREDDLTSGLLNEYNRLVERIHELEKRKN